MTDDQLRDIARTHIFDMAQDPEPIDLAELYDLEDDDLDTVIHLINSATINVSWEPA